MCFRNDALSQSASSARLIQGVSRNLLQKDPLPVILKHFIPKIFPEFHIEFLCIRKLCFSGSKKFSDVKGKIRNLG